MRFPDTPFASIDWEKMPRSERPGEVGLATWRAYTNADLRVRVVDYSPGYRADHWCDRGHVLFVVRGSLRTELADGRSLLLRAGSGYVVSDFGDAAHRSSTEEGATLFIVD